MLFLVRLPLTILGRRIGRGVFRRPRYLAKTPNRTTPAESDANTTYSNTEHTFMMMILIWLWIWILLLFVFTFCVVDVCGIIFMLLTLLNAMIIDSLYINIKRQQNRKTTTLNPMNGNFPRSLFVYLAESNEPSQLQIFLHRNITIVRINSKFSLKIIKYVKFKDSYNFSLRIGVFFPSVIFFQLQISQCTQLIKLFWL